MNAGSPSVRRTALVTGASAGIGEAFAHAYARRGVHLVLTARRGERLTSLADRLQRDHDVIVHTIPADLTDPASAATICDELSSRRVAIDILVNNAGYAVPGHYINASWETHAQFLQVMVVAYAEWCHRLVPSMVERSWGRVINVASVAGLIPGSAGHTLYGASKAFLIKFSQALASEVERNGVHVTALCPGYTHSEFHDVAGSRELTDRLPRFMRMDASTVAEEGIEANEAGRRVQVNGAVNKAIVGFAKLFPDSMLYAVGRRLARRARR